MPITYIDAVEIKNKTVLLRADFDVSLNEDATIANDVRIQQNIPTIQHLLKNNNRVICVAKLNRPHGRDRDPRHSLGIVVERLKQYLPDNTVTLIDDFLTTDPSIFKSQISKEILVLENIRFYKEEKQNDQEFAKKLAHLADVYVNDAFAMAHRAEASVVGVPHYIPGYGGLLLKKEVETISRVIDEPRKPVVVVLGGSKISTKINLIGKLLSIADYVLVGGGIANTFLASQNIEVGKSIFEYDEKENARRLLYEAKQQNTEIILPSDAVVGDPVNTTEGGVVKTNDQITREDNILDIGPETQARWGSIMNAAKTIIWNGPVGYFENPQYRRGTDFIYYTVAHTTDAISVVGGGDTLAAISKKEYLDNITHISTGGGAMLEFIEKGTLPGLEALNQTD
ncbi:phosphoglycerate kinase [Candidatus Woesebacteria bacterium]|nr:phosphoglycerate kinase [Candidatus Woesebacteria bacterium]MBP6883404.1 phosphoglycerate kinase [Candidatus Woesebacteria bacterium]